jgi:hypothetical protein
VFAPLELAEEVPLLPDTHRESDKSVAKKEHQEHKVHRVVEEDQREQNRPSIGGHDVARHQNGKEDHHEGHAADHLEANSFDNPPEPPSNSKCAYGA